MIVETDAHLAAVEQGRDRLARPAARLGHRPGRRRQPEPRRRRRRRRRARRPPRRRSTADSLATLIYTSRHHRPAQGLRAHPRQLPRPRRERRREARPRSSRADGASTLLFLPLAHVFARFIQVLAVDGRGADGPLVRHQDPARRLRRVPADLRPRRARGSSRRSTTPPRPRPRPTARARSSTGAADGRDRLVARRRTPAGPGSACRLQHAVFDQLVYGKLRAAMGGTVHVRRLRRRPARRPARPLLPRHRRHRPRGLRPHRDHRRRPPSTARRDAGSAPSAGRCPASTSRIADDGEILLRGGQRLRAATGGNDDGDRRGASTRRLVPHRRHRRARRRRLPADHRPQEGDPGDRRRQERRPRRARGPAARPPAWSASASSSATAAVHRRAGHPRRGDVPGLGRATTGSTACRSPRPAPTSASSPRSRRPSTTPTRRSPRPSRSASSRSSPPTSPRRAASSRRSLKLKRNVVMKEFERRGRRALRWLTRARPPRPHPPPPPRVTAPGRRHVRAGRRRGARRRLARLVRRAAVERRALPGADRAHPHRVRRPARLVAGPPPRARRCPAGWRRPWWWPRWSITLTVPLFTYLRGGWLTASLAVLTAGGLGCAVLLTRPGRRRRGGGLRAGGAHPHGAGGRRDRRRQGAEDRRLGGAAAGRRRPRPAATTSTPSSGPTPPACRTSSPTCRGWRCSPRPGRWVAGDVRWAVLFWSLVLFAGLWALARGRVERAAAVTAVLVLAPGTLTQVDQAWTEPVLAALIVWWAVLVRRDQRLVGGRAAGAGLRQQAAPGPARPGAARAGGRSGRGAPSRPVAWPRC